MELNAQQIIDRAATANIKSRLWERHGKCRIYAATQKGMAVYLECDGHSGDIEGAAFKVFCNTEQHPNWQKAQVAEHKQAYLGLFHAYVVEMYKDCDTLDAFGADMSEMIVEAREFFETQEKV